MHFGISMFHTDYSIPAVQLASVLEERGFESMWAPEHSHIPVPRRTPFPGGGELPKPYYEVMDPLVLLSAAAAVTRTLKLGGAFPHAARRAIRYGDGWVPIAGRAPYGDVNEYLPKFKQMVAEAGSPPDAVPITLFGGTEGCGPLEEVSGYGRRKGRHHLAARAGREDLTHAGPLGSLDR